MRIAEICLLLICCAFAVDAEPSATNPNPYNKYFTKNVSPYMLSNGQLRSTNVLDEQQGRLLPFSVISGNGRNKLDSRVSSNEDNIQDLEDEIASLKIEIEVTKTELELEIQTHSHNADICSCLTECPYPFKRVGDSCLILILSPVASFPNADLYCIYRGGHLAVPDQSWQSGTFAVDFAAAFSISVSSSATFWVGAEIGVNGSVMGLDGKYSHISITGSGSATVSVKVQMKLQISVSGSYEIVFTTDNDPTGSLNHGYICAHI